MPNPYEERDSEVLGAGSSASGWFKAALGTFTIGIGFCGLYVLYNYNKDYKG